MALRRLVRFDSEDGMYAAIVYHDAEWQEYRVKFIAVPHSMEGADYHTDDKQDAIATAKFFCQTGGFKR